MPHTGYSSASRLKRVSFTLILIALLSLAFADLQIVTADPWFELGKMSWGFLTPDLFGIELLYTSLLNTLAFAICGTVLGNLLGFLLALVYQTSLVRIFCALVRSIHEIFWALLFLQIFGLSTLTGILAIAIPYAGIFAKVYAEILEESDDTPLKALAQKTPLLSRFFYVRLPLVWPHFCHYSRYRLECSIRTSAILGFIGLPTLGFHLETAFSQGLYSQAAALLYVFFILIISLRYWAKLKIVPFLFIAALMWLPDSGPVNLQTVMRFLSEDIVPSPLRGNQDFSIDALWEWLWPLLQQQALPGVFNTLVLSLIAVVVTGAVTLLLFPWLSHHFANRCTRGGFHVLLVIFRSIPELMLAFIITLLIGPSMLPAILALSLHNGAIIAYLIAHHADTVKTGPDPLQGINRYAYVVLPQIYRQFLAFLFYRWEVITRETAILGILGVHTLGFYVDSAFEDLRFDRALALILMTALLNIMLDQLTSYLRRISRAPLSREARCQ